MTQEFVTLPREIVEQAIYALYCTNSQEGSPAYNLELKAIKELRAALEQSQNHVPDAGNMTLEGWKMVPVEPTHKITSAMLESEAQDDEGKFPPLFDLLDFSGANKALTVVKAAYSAMLNAAPQPPVLEQQGEQKPDAWLHSEGKAQPLYLHPQARREPLTDEQVLKAVRHLYQSDSPVGMGFSDDLDVARAIEAAHNIK